LSVANPNAEHMGDFFGHMTGDWVKRSVAAALLFAASLAPWPASAHEAEVPGQVLALLPKAEAVVRLELPGDGLRIATVRLVPGPGAHALALGDRIVGVVDTDPTPWTLAEVRIVGKDALTGTVPTAEPVLGPTLRYVHEVKTGDTVPDSAFVDQRGQAFSLRDFRGQSVVLAFIYTRCTDIRECPLVSGKFAALQRLFRGAPVHLVQVSLDPSFDRPRILAAYARRFDADPTRWTFATGDPTTVLNFVDQFNVTAFPDARLGVIHSERTVLIDPSGVVRNMLDDIAWSPSEIVSEVRHDEGLSANPLERLNLWLSSAAVAMCGSSVQSFSGFSDLLVVIGIFGLCGYVSWRLARALRHAA
jgi:cytochrome oxidase Cu insertion factor (SCO1/SenC/PrrC family)